MTIFWLRGQPFQQTVTVSAILDKRSTIARRVLHVAHDSLSFATIVIHATVGNVSWRFLSPIRIRSCCCQSELVRKKPIKYNFVDTAFAGTGSGHFLDLRARRQRRLKRLISDREQSV